jgi:hypothetical protein
VLLTSCRELKCTWMVYDGITCIHFHENWSDSWKCEKAGLTVDGIPKSIFEVKYKRDAGERSVC